MSSDERRSTVIFQHIPKTAGSTLHAILNSRFRRDEIWNVFGANRDDPSILEFRDLPFERKRRIRLLKGHMPFGLHEYLPQDAWYFTIIRDPIRRVVSQFFYIRRNPHNEHHDTVMENRMTLAEFLQSGESPGLNDGQVRWLAGDIHEVPFGGTSEGLLEKALQNTREHYDFLIPTGDFDTGLLMLADRFGWRFPPIYRRENVRRPDRDPYEVTPDDLEAVREYNRLDIRLFDTLKARFEDEREGRPRLHHRTKTFKRFNMLYQTVARPLSWISRLRPV